MWLNLSGQRWEKEGQIRSRDVNYARTFYDFRRKVDHMCLITPRLASLTPVTHLEKNITDAKMILIETYKGNTTYTPC